MRGLGGLGKTGVCLLAGLDASLAMLAGRWGVNVANRLSTVADPRPDTDSTVFDGILIIAVGPLKFIDRTILQPLKSATISTSAISTSAGSWALCCECGHQACFSTSCDSNAAGNRGQAE